jgi:hypothetical protein
MTIPSGSIPSSSSVLTPVPVFGEGNRVDGRPAAEDQVEGSIGLIKASRAVAGLRPRTARS